MKRYAISCVENYDMGDIGLALDGVNVPHGRTFVAREGLLLAHDIVEHQNGLSAIGSIEDELEALGGLWFARGYFNDVRRERNVDRYRAIAHDIVSLLEDWWADGDADLTVPVTRACEVDADLQRCIDEAKRQAFGFAEKDEPFRKILLPRMRIGYRKAMRRFKGEHATANNLFWNIADVLDSIAKVDEEDLGRRWRLTLEGCNADVEEIEPPEYVSQG